LVITIKTNKKMYHNISANVIAFQCISAHRPH